LIGLHGPAISSIFGIKEDAAMRLPTIAGITVLALASGAIAQEGPLKHRVIDVDLRAAFPDVALVRVPVDPPVAVLRGAEVVLDAIDLGWTKDRGGSAGVQLIVSVRGGGRALGFAEMPDLQLVGRQTAQSNTTRIRIPLTSAGVIEEVQFSLAPVVIAPTVNTLIATATGIEGSTEVDMYVAYAVRETIRPAHSALVLPDPDPGELRMTGVSPWQSIDARGADNDRLGDTALITLSAWSGPLDGSIGSVMAEAVAHFDDGSSLALDDAHSPSTGQPRAPEAQHYGVDNALAPATPIAARIQSIDVRVNAVFESAGLVFYHALVPYTLRMYRTDWRCYADANQDGALNIFDYLSYQNAFMEGDPYADCDSDGVLTIFDFLCYQNAYDTGEACP
jgi:hypothetical protein